MQVQHDDTASRDATDSTEVKGGLKDLWKRSTPGLVAVGFFSVFINILKLATPIYVLQILDRVVASRSVETLIMLTVITVIAVLTAILLEMVRRRMFIHWGTWIESSLGPRLFQIGMGKTSETPSSSTLLRDAGTLRSFVAGNGLTAWLDVIWAPLFVACVFLIAPLLGVVVCVCICVTLILGFLNERATRDARNAALRARNDDRHWVTSAESNRETVGSLNMVGNLSNLWSQSAAERLDERSQTQVTNANFTAGMRFFGRCLRVFIFCVGILLVIQEILTVGAVIAAGILGRNAYSAVERAMQRWRELIVSKSAYARIRTALEHADSVQISIPNDGLPVPLIIDGVGYRHPNQPSSLFRNLTVAVAPGEALCVIGPSAVGKTTLSRLVVGLLKPRSGQVRLGDVHIHRLQQDGLGRQIGYLPQDIRLFNGTIRDNIARMARGDLDLVVEAAKLADLHEVILALPNGYDTIITEEEPLLSAGRRKAIALARAFYAWPSLVVLDEPEPNLDQKGRAALIRAIKTLKSQGTILVVTTQSRTILSRIADKAVLFDQSKIITLTDPSEIDALRRQKTTNRRSTK